MVDPVYYAFRPAIERHFAFLFDSAGFALVAERNVRSGEYQLQVAASPECQIKFLLQQEVFELRFGRTGAPREFADEDATGATAWYSFWGLMGFEDHLHPAQEMHLPPPTGVRSVDDEMAFQAALLRHYLPRLAAAFSPRPPAGWWMNFETWRAAH
jgi:hypothetical protein